MRFEEILVTLTVVTGGIYLAYYCYSKITGNHKNKHQHKLPWLIELCKSFFPVFFIVLLLRSFLFEPFRIPTGSMKPTLLEGDFILVNKYAYGLRLPILGIQLVPVGQPKVGDILVFRHKDGIDMIKRVIGVPGDHIVNAKNKLYINGKLIPSKELHAENRYGIYTTTSVEYLPNNIDHAIYTHAEARNNFPYGDIIVPPNSYFMMGDNRSNSQDSRFWGFVRDQDILGKAIYTWMSWDSSQSPLSLPVRWSRIGKSVYKYDGH